MEYNIASYVCRLLLNFLCTSAWNIINNVDIDFEHFTLHQSIVVWIDEMLFCVAKLAHVIHHIMAIYFINMTGNIILIII